MDLNIFGFHLLGNERTALWTTPSDDEPPFLFPSGFHWGSAVAAQHVEHNQPSDWTAFEQRVARENLSRGKPGTAEPGHIRNWTAWPEDIRTKKTDFDRQYASDFALLREMGHNSFRFSFDWARIFPEPSNTPDAAGIEFYHAVLKSMQENGLTPFGTLFHFATPQWFWEVKDGKRGWERSDAMEHWGRFVGVIAREFGGQVQDWCTLNEPFVYLFNGYIEGIFPPLERRSGLPEIIEPMVALLKAHALAYDILHEDARRRGQQTMVGITKHTRAFEPLHNWSLPDRHLAALTEATFLWAFLDAIHTGILNIPAIFFSRHVPGLRGKQDYVGINYYGRFYVQFNLLNPASPTIHMHDPGDRSEVKSDLEWAIYPHGFYHVLTEAARRYRKPIFVLENGIADGEANDRRRQQFLVTHLYEMWLAMRRGDADIRGYMHWSTMDNFEWAEGFEPKFGLIEIDYRNDFARKPRPSAALYSQIISGNGISAENWNRYRHKELR